MQVDVRVVKLEVETRPKHRATEVLDEDSLGLEPIAGDLTTLSGIPSRQPW